MSSRRTSDISSVYWQRRFLQASRVVINNIGKMRGKWILGCQCQNCKAPGSPQQLGIELLVLIPNCSYRLHLVLPTAWSSRWQFGKNRTAFEERPGLARMQNLTHIITSGVLHCLLPSSCRKYFLCGCCCHRIVFFS